MAPVRNVPHMRRSRRGREGGRCCALVRFESARRLAGRLSVDRDGASEAGRLACMNSRAVAPPVGVGGAGRVVTAGAGAVAVIVRNAVLDVEIFPAWIVHEVALADVEVSGVERVGGV